MISHFFLFMSTSDSYDCDARSRIKQCTYLFSCKSYFESIFKRKLRQFVTYFFFSSQLVLIFLKEKPRFESYVLLLTCQYFSFSFFFEYSLDVYKIYVITGKRKESEKISRIYMSQVKIDRVPVYSTNLLEICIENS